ncbi:MAG: GNAT family acetyltransferase [Planctomycetota bacterium]
MLIRDYHDSDQSDVIHLWERCGLTRPWNDPSLDIRRKLDGQPNWLLVGILNDRLVASVMVGYEGHRGWINYLAVDPDHQRSGFGRALMVESERRLREQRCPKINLQIRKDNLDAIRFYESVGYSQDEVVSLGKRLTPDSPQ